MADTQAQTTPTQSATPSQVAWLKDQLPTWQAAGLVGEAEGAAILSRYRAVRRLSLGRLLLFLGAAFVGVGLIWLVAANLDQFRPIVRFAIVTVLWLGVTAGAELLARQPRHRVMSPVTGAACGLSALMFGAVVFQAAQSLQVPAYESALVGWWSLGALAYAYAVRGLAPLVVGIATGLVWFIWHTVERSETGLGVVLAFLVAATTLSGVSVLHQRFGPARFGVVWRDVAAALLLVGFFIAALPEVDRDDFSFDTSLVVAVVAALALAALALAVGTDTSRFEPLAAAAVTVAGVLLVLWDPGRPADGQVGVEDWGHAATSVAAYVVVAAWVAALGILRNSERLTWLALAALVIFTTVQSFAVFAAIIDGAWLFLVLGVIFAGSGFLFDRGRRELESSLEGAQS